MNRKGNKEVLIKTVRCQYCDKMINFPLWPDNKDAKISIKCPYCGVRYWERLTNGK